MKVSKSDWAIYGALALLAGGAYMAATSANSTNQKLALVGSGVGLGIVVVNYL